MDLERGVPPKHCMVKNCYHITMKLRGWRQHRGSTGSCYQKRIREIILPFRGGNLAGLRTTNYNCNLLPIPMLKTQTWKIFPPIRLTLTSTKKVTSLVPSALRPRICLYSLPLRRFHCLLNHSQAVTGQDFLLCLNPQPSYYTGLGPIRPPVH